MKKPYNLEERTFQFAKEVALFIKKLKLTLSNQEYIKQLIRSSGSIGANYIEANESLGKKDFIMHLRISRKEAKESGFWLRLIFETNDPDPVCKNLLQESKELKLIFTGIIEK